MHYKRRENVEMPGVFALRAREYGSHVRLRLETQLRKRIRKRPRKRLENGAKTALCIPLLSTPLSSINSKGPEEPASCAMLATRQQMKLTTT